MSWALRTIGVEVAPFVFALERVIEVGGNSGSLSGRMRVISYRRDFDIGWSTEEAGLLEWIRRVAKNKDQPAVVVIINDGMPPLRQIVGSKEVFDAPDLTSHVSPFECVVALLCRLFDSAKHAPTIYLQIHLFDPWASRGEHEGFGSRTLRALGPAIEGFHLYEATCADEEEAESFLSAESPSPMEQRLLRSPLGVHRLIANLGICGRSKATTMRIQPGAEPDWLADLRSRWSNRLTAPLRRHSVSNLVAPILLARGFAKLGMQVNLPALSYSSLTSALESLLEALRLVPSMAPERNAVSSLSTGVRGPIFADTMVKADIFGQFERISLLLIDDHSARGYTEIAKAALFGSAEVEPPGWSVRAESSPAGLLRHIDDVAGLNHSALGDVVCDVCGGRGERHSGPIAGVLRMLGRSETSGGGPGEFQVDILLLDLRLFDSDFELQKAEGEREHLQHMLDLFHAVACNRQTRREGEDALLTAALSAKRRLGDLNATIGSFGRGRATVERIEHLALLPLLLSAIDPSFPIVIFSSTRQRRLIDLLATAPNIVTSFAKPAMTGTVQEGLIEDSARELLASLKVGLHLHELRFIWKRLLRLDWHTRMPTIETVDTTTDRWKVTEYQWKEGERPRPNRDELRELLARHYIHYLQGKHYFDFLSVPWELLEGCLTPESLLKDSRVGGTQFKFPLKPKERRAIEPRAEAALAVGLIRHKKAHGHTRPPTSVMEAEKYRIGAIMLFLFLVDFIEGQTHAREDLVPTVREMYWHLANRYSHFPHPRDYSPLEPNKLTSDTLIDWEDCCAYTFLVATDRASKVNQIALSAGTIRAVQRFCRHRVDRLWDLLAAPVGRQLDADVLREVRSPKGVLIGYILKPSGGRLYCGAWLDERSAKGRHSVGSRICVEITGVDRVRWQLNVSEV